MDYNIKNVQEQEQSRARWGHSVALTHPSSEKQRSRRTPWKSWVPKMPAREEEEVSDT
jgi:hypothetical protein